MKDFDLPATAVPVQFLDRRLEGVNWQIGDEFPFNSFAIRWSVLLIA